MSTNPEPSAVPPQPTTLDGQKVDDHSHSSPPPPPSKPLHPLGSPAVDRTSSTMDTWAQSPSSPTTRQQQQTSSHSSPERFPDFDALRVRDTRTEFSLPPLPPDVHRDQGRVSVRSGSHPSSQTKTETEGDAMGGGQELGYQADYSGNGTRRRPIRTNTAVSRRSEIEWADGFEKPRPLTVAKRLEMTITEAEDARRRFAYKSKWSGYVLNAAIGLQVLLGSLTTGLSAVATSGRSAAIQTTILGGLSTIVASYLARARGSGEPEWSASKVDALDGYLRRVRNFTADNGHVVGNEHDARIDEFRKELDYLLGTVGADGDSGRALSTVPTHVAAPSFHPHHATNVRPPV